MKIINIFKETRNGNLPNFAYMFQRIWDYSDRYSEIYGASKVHIFIDYFLSAFIYGCSGNDYFLYDFFLLKRRGRKEFLTEMQEENFEKAHTNTELNELIGNKEKTLYYFHEYIERDWCGYEINNSPEDYASFVAKHEYGIMKPLNGLGGRGIEIVNVVEKFGSSEALREYCMTNKCLIEELIQQHEELNNVYSQAINTIRVVTLKGQCIGAALRMGVGSAKVDNAHAGGIFAEVDINNGIVIGQAMRYTNERFTLHPTTGAVIPGTKIPCWSECKATVEEASKKVSKVFLIGWDIAVTPNGPTIVEVNTHPGLELVQAPNGHGLKSEFIKVDK